MSNPWYTILGPQDWDGVQINTGNKKVDGKYYNVLGDKNVQLSASGIMWLVGGSGIRLISAGDVDVSGMKVMSLRALDIKKIDSSGTVVPTYAGPSGSLLFKYSDHEAASIPGGQLVFNTGLNKLTMPGKNYGLLYLNKGPGKDDDQKAVDTWPQIQFIPEKIIDNGPNEDPTIIPPETSIGGIVKFTDTVQIYPNLTSFKDSILTHMGADAPAEWQAAPYLKAEGIKWNRYPKRPAIIEPKTGRLIFYKNKPQWAQDYVGTPSVQDLTTELGIGYDTIQITTVKDRVIRYAKLAAEIRYIADETDPDILTPLSVLFDDEDVKFQDPDDPLKEKAPRQEGIAVKLCPREGSPAPARDPLESPYNVYVHSVTKGGYLDMQLAPDASGNFSCDNTAAGPFRFKPSTYNTISIRPEIHTSFNKLAENIDFIVYGETKTRYDNYEGALFNLDKNNVPIGLVPAFKVDANIPNAVSGNPSSGVLFTKYIDRDRVTPSGFNVDEQAKITINTNKPYVIDSIPSGTGLVGNVAVTGYIQYYADLTVNSTLYSQNIITDRLYLRPKPLDNNDGEYIANSLLTIDRSGRIVSRIPKTNPVIPEKPFGLRPDPGHQSGIGNGEISLVWTAPSGDGRSSIIDYKLEFSTNSGETWSSIPNNLYEVSRPSPTFLAASILGLSPITPYIFRVAAQNGIGVGPFSVPSDEITVGSSVPKAPVNLSASRAFDETTVSNIQLVWEQPQAGTAQEILGYTIEESIDNGITWYWYNTPTALISELGELITGTLSDTDYIYRVSAWNTYGQSAFAYVRSASNLIIEIDPEEIKKEEEKKTDVLSNWDFGSVLFTGVCIA